METPRSSTYIVVVVVLVHSVVSVVKAPIVEVMVDTVSVIVGLGFVRTSDLGFNNIQDSKQRLKALIGLDSSRA